MGDERFIAQFAQLVGTWESLGTSAGKGIFFQENERETEVVEDHPVITCAREVYEQPIAYNVAAKSNGDTLRMAQVGVIAFGAIHCDNICDYLESFGNVTGLENQYSANGHHVDVFSFEDAASAAAAASTLTHYAPNDRGKRIRLEIRIEI